MGNVDTYGKFYADTQTDNRPTRVPITRDRCGASCLGKCRRRPTSGWGKALCVGSTAIRRAVRSRGSGSRFNQARRPVHPNERLGRRWGL